MMAAGADRILDDAALYDSLEAAIADCTFVVAATARAHDQAKPVVGAAEAAQLMAPRVAAGETVAIVFGRERNGLENDEVALADRILTLPVNPAFASLNLAQAVVIVAYEWFKLAGAALPFAMPEKSAPAPKQQLLAFFASLEARAGEGRVLPPARQARHHADQSAQHLHAHAADPAGHPDVARRDHGDRGGPQGSGARRLLDGEEAEMLRALLAEHGEGRVPSERGPVRGLARLLRRNPTEAERTLLAGTGERPPLRRPRLQAADAGRSAYLRFRVLPAEGGARSCAGARRRRRDARAERHAWLIERGYRVIEMPAGDVEADVGVALDRLAEGLGTAGAVAKR